MVRAELSVLAIVFLVSIVALMSYAVAPASVNGNAVNDEWGVPCVTGWKTWDACKFRGVCRGAFRLCGEEGWWSKCQYPETYQEKETECDGLDNDCDGFTDEGC